MGRPVPQGPGRRAPGLSQIDLAELLGVGLSTVQRFEYGKTKHVDPSLLDRVAKVLRMGERDRVELYRRAIGRDPEPSYLEQPASRLTPFWRNSINNEPLRHWTEGDHLVHGPITYANSLDWVPLAGNAAFDEMFTSGRRPENMFYWIATAADQLLEHREIWLRLLLPQLRGLLFKYPDHKGLLGLERWCQSEPSVREMWHSSAQPSYQTPDGALRPFFHAVYGRGTLELGVLAPSRSGDRDLRIFSMHFHEGVTPEEVNTGRERLPEWSS